MDSEKCFVGFLSFMVLVIGLCIGYNIYKSYEHENILIQNGFVQERVPYDYTTIWVKKEAEKE